MSKITKQRYFFRNQPAESSQVKDGRWPARSWRIKHLRVRVSIFEALDRPGIKLNCFVVQLHHILSRNMMSMNEIDDDWGCRTW
jgi:hypothetical protein